ncbi:dienelactone hydrolase family protein [Paenibacillus puerhi]|uniref:dienelactone hydrolase family protein n=1 Tax=Paenibacillus puerhi TaxID=2692622 RepID=UPI001356D088|nr:alpha/beta hydrolase [Paenibacillus puerhi]
MSYKLSERHLGSIPSLLDRVETVEQWEAKRAGIKEAWLRLLGTAPELRSPEELGCSYEVIGEPVIEAEGEEAGCHRREIRYETCDEDTVQATLLLPDPHRFGSAGLPAVLALHPTAAEGRLDVATTAGRDNRKYGLELARRGYVVLAPDSITCGSRIYPGAEAFQTAPFYERYPDWTVCGKMLSDHSRALDVLCALPEVDPARVGVIGHSLGGYNGWFLAGLDERVSAAASSCGFSMFTEDPDPNRWGQRDWFSHFPRITAALAEDRIPFEWHEIAALAAPKSLWMWSGMRDRIFPNWPAIGAGMSDLDSLYKFVGEEGAFEFWMGNTGHDFPEQARSLAYDFLDRHLGKKVVKGE